MTAIKAAFAKATVQGVMALTLTFTLSYLAISGAVQGETFLAAVVGSALGWAFGAAKKAE